MNWVDKPQNYKDLYGILQLLRGSHLNNFPLKTLKLGWVAFHSVTFQLKSLDSQSNQYKKLVPVLSQKSSHCGAFEVEHSKRYQNRVLIPKRYDEHPPPPSVLYGSPPGSYNVL